MTSYRRTETLLTDGWRFTLDDPEEASARHYDDSDWRRVAVPHDWSAEEPFDSSLEGATGYLPGGIGWYRATFSTPDSPEVYLMFDGVYNNVTVYLNGELLGEHPYGYTPFFYHVSGRLLPGDNVLAVRVDHSRYSDSRWYTGSGIYRSVELVSAAPTHVAPWGVFVTTPGVMDMAARVLVQTDVVGSLDSAVLTTRILDANDVCVAQSEDAAQQRTSQELTVLRPDLWSVDTPHLYRVTSTVSVAGELVDEVSTRVGLRTIRFDAREGFFLNGERTVIKGVCLHHDAGCVGAAVPRDVWRRRLTTLRTAGVNAIRTSHNPASQEFLNLCDDMGFLVQEEFFDEWDTPKDKRKNTNEKSVDFITRGYTEHFHEWAERDLAAAIVAHRNHPSIIQWSIGNEIEWTYPRNADATGFFDADWSGNYFWDQPPHSREQIRNLLGSLPRGEYDIGETAQRLAAWTRSLDATRPVIANCILPSASYESGYADALDVIGFSYRRVMYDYGHEHYPDLPIMGTENLPQWHEWKSILERPFVAGVFLWTGIDYLGEADGQWPTTTTASGLLDRAGFEKTSFHMMKSLWNDQPHIHLTTQTVLKSPYELDPDDCLLREEDPTAWERKLWVWHDVNTHWNYRQGELIAVEVYSNCDSVELLLNGESLGAKSLDEFDDHIFKWAVPFVAGNLVARGVSASDALATAGAPASVDLVVDGCHVIAQVLDSNGRPVKHLEVDLEIDVVGATLLGADNGSPSSTQDFSERRITTSQGRALVVVAGVGHVSVSSPGLASASVNCSVS
ncbi:MAG: glycoside hydrolase family 2 TIM barrel-domain containing protein [Rhodoglobus sp.]